MNAARYYALKNAYLHTKRRGGSKNTEDELALAKEVVYFALHEPDLSNALQGLHDFVLQYRKERDKTGLNNVEVPSYALTTLVGGEFEEDFIPIVVSIVMAIVLLGFLPDLATWVTEMRHNYQCGPHLLAAAAYATIHHKTQIVKNVCVDSPGNELVVIRNKNDREPIIIPRDKPLIFLPVAKVNYPERGLETTLKAYMQYFIWDDYPFLHIFKGVPNLKNVLQKSELDIFDNRMAWDGAGLYTSVYRSDAEYYRGIDKQTSGVITYSVPIRSAQMMKGVCVPNDCVLGKTRENKIVTVVHQATQKVVYHVGEDIDFVVPPDGQIKLRSTYGHIIWINNRVLEHLQILHVSTRTLDHDKQPTWPTFVRYVEPLQ